MISISFDALHLFYNSLNAILADLTPLAIICLKYLTISVITYIVIRKFKLNIRRSELNTHVLQALRKRDTKEHNCLSYFQNNEGAAEKIYSASETRRLIAMGRLDPAENLCKLARRCRKYGRNNASDTAINAITEEFYDEEYNVAQTLTSNEFKDTPPLYGVPISVKDCLALKGALQTGGLACRTPESFRSDKDSAVIQVLRQSACALPMVRGNVCQLLILAETDNHVWGKTRNPWDLSRIPGGSSGGDGALVSMKCVPLAVASDVAGSIRIPASYCGVVGFKPTSTRFIDKGSMRPRKVTTCVAKEFDKLKKNGSIF